MGKNNNGGSQSKNTDYLSLLNIDRGQYPLPNSWNFTNYQSHTATTSLSSSTETRTSNNIEIGNASNSHEVRYVGPGKTDADAAAVRANHPIPPQVGIYYFEMTVRDKGRDGYIAIGLSCANVSLNRLPGWENDSLGYHGDDGNSFLCSGTGKPFGPSFGTGDVIGCGIDFIKKSIFYTKNGTYLGAAFDLPRFALPSKGGMLTAQGRRTPANPGVYPSIGLRTPGEVVSVNFDASDKFAFDIADYVMSVKLGYYAGNVFKGGIAEKNILRNCVRSLILSYFLHSGYAESAQCFFKENQTPNIHVKEAKDWSQLKGIKHVLPRNWSLPVNCGDTGNESENERKCLEVQLSSLSKRNQIFKLIHEGKLQEARELLMSTFSNSLISEDLLLEFSLQEFIEMLLKFILKHDSVEDENRLLQEIFVAGKKLNCKGGSDFQERLHNIFALLAYKDPHKSPLRNLLNVSFHRESLCQKLNRDFQKIEGRHEKCPLEVLITNQMAIEQMLSEPYICDGTSAIINIQNDFLKTKHM